MLWTGKQIKLLGERKKIQIFKFLPGWNGLETCFAVVVVWLKIACRLRLELDLMMGVSNLEACML